MTRRKLAYSVAETAELLGCSEWLVRRAVKRGRLPKVHPEMSGGRILIPAVALERAIDDLATFEGEASCEAINGTTAGLRPAAAPTPAPR